MFLYSFFDEIFFYFFFKNWVRPGKIFENLNREQWRAAPATAFKEGEWEEEATLRGGEVWLAVVEAEATGELREGFPLVVLFCLLPVSAAFLSCLGRCSPRWWWCCCCGCGSKRLLWRRRGREQWWPCFCLCFHCLCSSSFSVSAAFFWTLYSQFVLSFFTYFSPTLLVRLISVHVCFFYSAIL